MGSFPGRPFTDATLRCDRVTHVISRTRPSRFSACNIEKLGMGLGTRLTERAATHSHHGLSEPSREKEKLEQLQLVALKFKMIRELAKVKEQQAMKELQKIKPKSLGS